MKTIVSFTTSPKRISECQKMVDSIIRQTKTPDLFMLNIPQKFSRDNSEYVVPDFMRNNVMVNVCDKDYGPITKILPTISYLREKGFAEDTRIIYLDDDVVYPEATVESLFFISKNNPKCVPAGSALNFSDHFEDRLVWSLNHGSFSSVAEGFAGVCVPLGTFDEDFFNYANLLNTDQDFFKSDDIVLSNYFLKKGLKIQKVDLEGVYSRYLIDLGILEYGFADDALFRDESHEKRYLRCIEKLNDRGENAIPFIKAFSLEGGYKYNKIFIELLYDHYFRSL